jgi:hypothetical protein
MRVVSLLCLLILAACSSASTPSALATPDPNVAFVVCQDAMEAQLRTPASADFASLNESTVTEGAGQQVEVRSYVDAQNGFGANVRTDFICIATPRRVQDIYTYDVVSLTTN